MAVINQYNDHVTAQGQVNSQASGNDFGAQVGGAVANVGQAGMDYAEARNKLEQDEGQIWGYKAAGDAYETLKKQFTQDVNSLDPNDPTFTEKVGKLTDNFHGQIEQTTSDLMASAPTRSAAKVVATHMATNGRTLLNGAISEQSRIMGEYTATQVEAGMKQDQDSLLSDPSDQNFDRIVANRKSSIGGLQTVDPTAKMKWMDSIENKLAVTAGKTIAATNPSGFLANVGAQGGRITSTGAVKGAVPGGSKFDSTMGFIFKQEGGYSATDGNTGNPVNFGINQKANPDVDVKNLTKEGAAKIYRERYWNAIGGDTLPANMATVAMNAAVNQGVDVANTLIAQSGGDPAKFTDLVKQRYQSIVAANPSQAKYLNGWLTRADAALATSSAAVDSGLPQVRPLTDGDVEGSKAPYAWWGRLNADQKITLVRQAEATVGGNLANERGEMTRAMSDINATLLAGKAYPNIDDPKFSRDNLTRLYGPDAGSRAFDQIDYAKRVGSFVTQMSNMPTAQASELLKSLEPQGGGEYATKAPVYQHALTAFTNLQKLRDKDYMSWAQNTQGTNVKPLDFSGPDQFRETLTARIAPAIVGKQDYGADAHLLSKDEASQLGDALNRMAPQDAMNYLKQVRQATIGHDEWFSDTLREVAPKNSMLAFAAATANKQGSVQTKGGAQSGDTVGKYVLEGAQILQNKDLGDPTKSGKPVDLEDKIFRTMFYNAVGPTAFQSPDADRSNQMSQDTYQAAKNYMVADMYHRGIAPNSVNINSDLVSNAINAVTGGIDKSTGSTLFLPWGTTQQQFKQQFPMALDVALVNSGIKGTSLDAPGAYKYANVGDGKYLITNANKTVVGTNGRPVIVDMSNYGRGR